MVVALMGGTEQHQNRITQHLIDRAAIGLDHFKHHCEEIIQQPHHQVWMVILAEQAETP